MCPDFCRTLLDNMHDGVYFVDRNRVITYWNKGAEYMTGYSAQEVLGISCSDNLLMHVDSSGQQLCLTGCPLSASMGDGKRRTADVFVHHKKGHRVPVSVRVAPIEDATGAIIGAVEIFSDNTAKVAALDRIEDLMRESLKDPLTGVGNRRYAEITLQSRFEEMRRHGWTFGVLFLDLDHFKTVNDTYGHDAGDRVLKMVSATLSAATRSFDFVGRWGGEEFIVLAPNMDRSQLQTLAERLRILVENSFYHEDGVRLHVTVSIGAALSREDDTPDSIVDRADQLMYASKDAGRNTVTIDAVGEA